MFYKVIPGNDLYEKLQAVAEKMKEALDAAHNFAFKILDKEYGIKAKSYRQGTYQNITHGFHAKTLAGGIMAFDIPDGKPKGWKNINSIGGTIGYFPQNIKSNKELRDRIIALPFVDDEVVSKIVQFETAHDEESNKVFFSPGMRLFNDGVTPHVLSFSAWVVPKYYTPLADMIEITKSEFDSIFKKEAEKLNRQPS